MTRTVVVLVNFQGAKDTYNCINSLLTSSVSPRLVVVDNTPNDPEIDAVVENYPGAKLIRSPRNLGFGQGNNLGIEWALANTDCEFFFILNNDAMLEVDTLKHLEMTMDTKPNAGLSVPRIVLAEDPSVLWYGGGEVDWKRGGAFVPGWMRKADSPLAMCGRYVTFASGCAMLIRRKVLEKVGSFDKRYFMYEEDLEFCLRAQESGYAIWYEPIALVRHVGQGSMRKGGKFFGILSPENPRLPFYVFHIVRNRLLTIYLHLNGLEFLKFLLGFHLFILAKLTRFIFHWRWDGIKAVYQGWVAYRQLRHTTGL